MKAIRWILRAAETLSIPLAARLAGLLFCTPLPLRRKAARVGPPEPGTERLHLRLGGQELALHRWPAAAAPAPKVLLVHGWAGRGLQLRHLAAPLAAAGCEVYALDLPAHGGSTGWTTNLLEFVGAIRKAAELFGPFAGIVGHSLGGNAVAYAASTGLGVGRIVLISALADPHRVTEEFAAQLGIAERTRAAMQRQFERRTGVPFAELDADATGPRVARRVLLVHDRDDDTTTYDDALHYARTLPQARAGRDRGARAPQDPARRAGDPRGGGVPRGARAARSGRLRGRPRRAPTRRGGRLRRERGVADPILGPLGAGRAVAHPFALGGQDRLPGTDVEAAAPGLDMERAAQHHRVLVELRRLSGLDPAGGAGHAGEAQLRVSGVDPAEEFFDELRLVARRLDHGGLVEEGRHEGEDSGAAGRKEAGGAGRRVRYNAPSPSFRIRTVTTAAAPPPARRPLDGVRVLEMGQLMAGPFAGTILAYFGAEVIKIEPPGSGDPVRGWRIVDRGTSLWWRTLGRNKRCVTLDLRQEAGRAIARRLAARSDVLIENFRPGTLERWGLAPADLRAENPGLVVARVSGFGQTGPYAARPGFAAVCEGFGGLRHVTGFPGGPPVRANLSLGDSLAGLHAALGILLALFDRDRGRGADGKEGEEGGRRGQTVDVAIFEAVYNLMEGAVPEFDRAGVVREPSGTTITGIVPTGTYLCADGRYLIVGGSGDSIYKRLMQAAGRPDLADDPRLATNEGRVRHRQEIDAALATWTATLPSARVAEILDGAAVPFGPIYTVEDMLADPHYRARGLFEEVEAGGAPLKIPALAPKLSDTPGRTDWAGPELGAHNREVFGDLLGIPDGELAALARDRVI